MPVKLVPFSSDAADTYLAGVRDRFSADKAISDFIPVEVSREQALQQHRRILPQGAATPDHHLRAVVDDANVAVGGVWYHHASGSREAFLYDIFIEASARRHGYGRAALAAIERDLAARGCEQLWLNVFARNVDAQRFYASLGYGIGTFHFQKLLK